MKIIARPDKFPLITIVVSLRAGSVRDPSGKGGSAWLTAAMLASAGSRKLEYPKILEALFPMGVSIGWQVDKEMTTFSAEVHSDHLDEFYQIFRDMLLDPGWREEDFERLRDDAVNLLEVELRSQNDEEFAKEVLRQQVYGGHPYERHNAGTISNLRTLEISDLKEFYLANYAQESIVVGLSGAFPTEFEAGVRRDFRTLPIRGAELGDLPASPAIEGNEAVLIEKPARGVAISLGYPIPVTRGHEDYVALLLAVSALGQHRMSSGRLFTQMRQLRGLNYGDYSYIEYFPGGMYSLEPEPNFARRQQMFELWIRPVAAQHAHFALRLALHEMERFVRHGLETAEFERSQSFLSKYVSLLLRDKRLELGYAIDSDFYGIDGYPAYIRAGLKSLTCEQVNAAIARHLRWDKVRIVFVGEGMSELREALLFNAESPMTYNSPKPEGILGEDRIVSQRVVPFRPETVSVFPAERFFT